MSTGVTEGLLPVEEVRDGLGKAGYLASESAALVSFLAHRLGKPVLVEVPPESARRSSQGAFAPYRARPRAASVPEGLDEAKALYEWNYRKQLLGSRPRPPAPGGRTCRRTSSRRTS